MERHQQTLLQGLLANDLFLEALDQAIQPEILDLSKKMRTAVRDGNLTVAADLGGQITGLERLVPILKRVTG